MTKLTIKDAFQQLGLRAEYEGNAAKFVPITAALAERIDFAGMTQPAVAGQMLVSWVDGEKRKGGVLNGDAKNDLTVLIQRTDGTDLRIDASDYRAAAIGVLEARKGARENAASVAKQNAAAQEAYDRAVARGETPDPVTPATPAFAADAFDKAMGLVNFGTEVAKAIKADPFADIAVKAAADGFASKITTLIRDQVTREEKAKIDEARQIRAEISMLAPNHADAAGAVLPAPYAGDGEKAREMRAALPEDLGGISAAQSSAMAANPDFALVKRLFSVATTTPAMEVQRMALSHAGFKRIAQELAKHENTEHGPAVVARMTAVTKDAMPTYDWQGKLFTKNDADVLLMRDQYAAFAYIWDSASRVNEVNVEAALAGTYAETDVPSDEELQRLKDVLSELRFDNGAEVDFAWDEEQDPALE